MVTLFTGAYIERATPFQIEANITSDHYVYFDLSDKVMS